MSENGEIYTAGKTFTLPPAVTALTNSNSDYALLEGRPHQHGPPSNRGGRPTSPAGHRLLPWHPGDHDDML